MQNFITMNPNTILKKNLKQLVAAVLAVTCFIGNIAAQNPRSNWFKVVPVNDAKAVNVIVHQGESEHYTVRLYSENGQLLWESGKKSSEFAKSLMLDDLSQGRYVMAVEHNDMVIEQPFSIVNDRVLVVDEENRISSPTLAVVGKTVMVDFPTNTAAKNVEVHLYDSSGAEVYTNEIVSDADRITRYDMSALPSGKYRMVFNIANSTFTRTIALASK